MEDGDQFLLMGGLGVTGRSALLGSPPTRRWANYTHSNPQQGHGTNADPSSFGGNLHELAGLAGGKGNPGHNPVFQISTRAEAIAGIGLAAFCFTHGNKDWYAEVTQSILALKENLRGNS
jgi:hypothetical protein